MVGHERGASFFCSRFSARGSVVFGLSHAKSCPADNERPCHFENPISAMGKSKGVVVLPLAEDLMTKSTPQQHPGKCAPDQQTENLY
eukprot:835459-Amphidinium_carterae.1